MTQPADTGTTARPGEAIPRPLSSAPRQSGWGRSGRARSGRGSRPADLSRLPVAPNLRAISLLEGLRAALAVAAVMLANQWVHSELMVVAALGALLTCFCDPGGPIARRVPPLLTFAVLGSVLFGALGLLRAAGLWAVVPVAGLLIFCNGMARVWGQPALVAGNILTVVTVLAVRYPLTWAQAWPIAGAFAAGSAWALLLALVIFRIRPYAPARQAIATAWQQLAALAADLRALLRRGAVSEAAWEEHARRRRRAAREAIEQARAVLTDTLRGRGPATSRAGQSLIRLAAAEQIFGAFIALSDLLERETDPGLRGAADRALRLIRPLLAVLAHAGLTDATLAPARLMAALAGIDAAARPYPALAPAIGRITDRLRIAATLVAPDGFLPGMDAAPRRPGLRERFVVPVRANLSWQSMVFRHALRIAVVAVPALWATLRWYTGYEHWLTITLVLTMQPFFAATWQRALERIGGTVLGGLAAAGIAMVCTTQVAMAAAMFPLAVVAFALRQVSFGTFIMCLTPLVVLLVELDRPGTSELAIAGMRALYITIGGLLALGGCLVLWPSWEPDRLRKETRAAIAAHAAYADAVLSAALPGGATPAAVLTARRGAGLASNNLEASLNRALNEPRLRAPPAMQGAALEAAMVVDAALRRMAGRLSALRLDPEPLGTMAPEAWSAWRDWIAGALRALAAEPPGAAGPRPAGEPVPALPRIARQVELMEGALRRETG